MVEFTQERLEQSPAKKRLDAMVAELGPVSERFLDFKPSWNSQYLGKIFLKRLMLKPSEQVEDRGRKIVAIDIRPYRISLKDDVGLAENRLFLEVQDYAKVVCDYDGGTGNFHKLINPADEKVSFQVVLVTAEDAYGALAHLGAGRPDGVARDAKEFNQKLKGMQRLEIDFMQAVDAMEMYFPRLGETTNDTLAEVWGRVLDVATIKLC